MAKGMEKINGILEVAKDQIADALHTEKNSISIEDLLIKACEYMESAAQWSQEHSFNIVLSDTAAAKAFVRLVEVYDCGSTGGFGDDPNQGGCQQPKDGGPKYSNIYDNVFARLKWLYIKYIGESEWEHQFGDDVLRFWTRK
jgi:hypothetical protein